MQNNQSIVNVLEQMNILLAQLVENTKLLEKHKKNIPAKHDINSILDNAIAFRWVKHELQPIKRISTLSLGDLKGIDHQKSEILRNTTQFVKGLPANNVLLTGSRGMGKSSLLRVLLNQFSAQGLRVIEVDKNELDSLPDIMNLLKERSERFIIYCDDLTFEQHDASYQTLKTLLDGSLHADLDNVLIYASSNRRHLMPEYYKDNDIRVGEHGEIRANDTIDDKISLSDRFGLNLYFYACSQDEYLAIVAHWLAHYKLELTDEARKSALQWATQRGNRSGRAAFQFAKDWAGRQSL